MKDNLDILLVHCPKFHDKYPPLGDISTINVIPAGMFGIADHLDKNDVDVKIMHQGIQRYKWGDVDPSAYFIDNPPAIAAFDLYWHQQSYDVINAARKLRRKFPQIVILLGGLTASYYAEEILNEFPFIDGVIIGDAEEPLLKLVKLVKEYCKQGTLEPILEPQQVRLVVKNEEDVYDSELQTSGFADVIPEEELLAVSNLVLWRKHRLFKSISRSYTSSDLLNRLDFSRLDLLDDSHTYLKAAGIPSIWVINHSLNWHHTWLNMMTKVYFPVVGRGCPHTCTWCGKEKRPNMVLRDPDVVAESIRNALDRGYENVYFSYDPYPEFYHHYIKIFRRLNKIMPAGGIPAYFESWGLPDKKFIEIFKNTFPEGVIALSPDTGSQKLRCANKTRSYTNRELFDTLDYMKQIGTAADVFFALGIPGDRNESIGKTIRLIKKIDAKYPNVEEIILSTLQMEPGAPWYEDPKSYKVISERKSFLDFYNANKPDAPGSYINLGYAAEDHYHLTWSSSSVADFGTKMHELRCKTRCFMKMLYKGTLYPRRKITAADIFPDYKGYHCRYMKVSGEY